LKTTYVKGKYANAINDETREIVVGKLKRSSLYKATLPLGVPSDFVPETVNPPGRATRPVGVRTVVSRDSDARPSTPVDWQMSDVSNGQGVFLAEGS